MILKNSERYECLSEESFQIKQKFIQTFESNLNNYNKGLYAFQLITQEKRKDKRIKIHQKKSFCHIHA